MKFDWRFWCSVLALVAMMLLIMTSGHEEQEGKSSHAEPSSASTAVEKSSRRPVSARDRVVNDPNNGKYFRFSPKFARFSVLGPGVNRALADQAKNHLHKLFRTHPSRDVHERFYWRLARGEVAVLFGGHSGVHSSPAAAITVSEVAGKGELVCLMVNPLVLLNRPVKISQQTIYHEYQHLLELDSGKMERKYFRPRTGEMPDKMLRPWFESEYRAHLKTAEWSASQGWRTQHEACFAYEVGGFAEFKQEIFKSKKGDPIRALIKPYVTKHRHAGVILAMFDLMSGPIPPERWKLALRARCLRSAKVGLRKKVAQVYSRMSHLTPPQRSKLLQFAQEEPTH